ncbi:MAG: hypothetical protein WAK01_10585 [Methylocystis sp.]
MAALEQKRLLEACRALGEAVGGQPMLPPLIREAGEGEGNGGTIRYSAAGDACIRFETRFDKAYVNRHEFPLKRLPLVIDCALCDSDRRPQEDGLDEREKFALLCAFFLAAQTPIGVEPIEDTGEYRLSLRLSPTFVVEWREAFDPAALESCEMLCRRVAASLWDKSREFFVSERIGVAVWSLRAAEELLGAPRLSPRAVGEFVAASLAEKRQEPAEASPAPVPQDRGEALAMMLSPPAAAEPDTYLAPAPPASGVGSRLALGGKPWRGLMTGAFAALIPLTLLVSVGTFISVYRKGDVETARVGATVAQPAPAPTAATAAAPPSAREDVASLEPAQAEKAQPAVDPKANSDASATKPAAASKGVARRAAHGKSRRGKNPFAQVGRAVGQFATDFWDGISSIPKRLNRASY